MWIDVISTFCDTTVVYANMPLLVKMLEMSFVVKTLVFIVNQITITGARAQHLTQLQVYAILALLTAGSAGLLNRGDNSSNAITNITLLLLKMRASSTSCCFQLVFEGLRCI